MPLAFPAPALRWSDDTDEQYAQSPITPVDSAGPMAFAIDPAILNDDGAQFDYERHPVRALFPFQLELVASDSLSIRFRRSRRV